jgi:hypothetical protein
MEAKSMKRKLTLVVAATFALAAQMSQANSADLRLIGSGASFPFPIYSAWFKDFSKKTDGSCDPQRPGLAEVAADVFLRQFLPRRLEDLLFCPVMFGKTGNLPFSWIDLRSIFFQVLSTFLSVMVFSLRHKTCDHFSTKQGYFLMFQGRSAW